MSIPKSYWLYTNEPFDNQKRKEDFRELWVCEGQKFWQEEKSESNSHYIFIGFLWFRRDCLALLIFAVC